MDGNVYEVNWPPVRPEAFFGDILPFIEHRKLAHQKDSPMTRQRLTWDQDELRKKWGMTLDETIELRKKEAAGRMPSGLYGYTKAVQDMCEVANRRIAKYAVLGIKRAAQKDPRVLDFLGAHAKRAKSLPARILLASYKGSLPKLAAVEKEAKHYGAYGYPAKTANLGFNLCSQMREHAGVVAADLHHRKAAMHANITGFLGAHGKQGKSGTSKLLLSVYPDEAMSFGKWASGETHPQSVDDWLAWEPDAS
jgi:hypothetical protein